MQEFWIKIGKSEKYDAKMRKLIRMLTNDRESIFWFFRLFVKNEKFYIRIRNSKTTKGTSISAVCML
jgi:hypothetical protein